MKLRVRNEDLEIIFLSLVISLLLFAGATLTGISASGANVTNQSVIARVNVSNTEPDLYRVSIDDPLDASGNIDLEAGNTTTITCNGSFSDINGFDDITSVNATLYDSNVASDAADDNNTHYTNTSCLQGSTCDENPSSQRNGSCICKFAVQYYANPAEWQCNMTITDSGGITSTEKTPLTTLNEIIGIELETLTINYGNLSVTETSDPIRENVTNVGNIPINITVRGFGGTNESIGQNVSMICNPDSSLANISFDNQRFDINNETAFASMNNLSNQTQQIPNLNLPQRTTDAALGNSTNSTFWRLRVPLGAGGICNGTIIFGALDATT